MDRCVRRWRRIDEWRSSDHREHSSQEHVQYRTRLHNVFDSCFINLDTIVMIRTIMLSKNCFQTLSRLITFDQYRIHNILISFIVQKAHADQLAALECQTSVAKELFEIDAASYVCFLCFCISVTKQKSVGHMSDTMQHRHRSSKRQSQQSQLAARKANRRPLPLRRRQQVFFLAKKKGVILHSCIAFSESTSFANVVARTCSSTHTQSRFLSLPTIGFVVGFASTSRGGRSVCDARSRTRRSHFSACHDRHRQV